jgi:hypothetical protein
MVRESIKLWKDSLNGRFRDSDFQKFTDRGEEIQLMKSQYRKMEMRLESYQKTNEQMDDQAR